MADTLTPESLRALLDAAGLPGATIEPLCHRVRIDDERWFGWYADDDAETMRRRIAIAVERSARRHDDAARVLGLPDVATVRTLAADLADVTAERDAARAEVARLTEAAAASRRFADLDAARGEARRVRALEDLAALAAERAETAPEGDRDRQWARNLLDMIGPEPGVSTVCPKCGGESWGGGTDSDPRPWCNRCGETQPGWYTSAGPDVPHREGGR